MSKSILLQFYDSLEPVKYKLRSNDNIFFVPKSLTLAGSHRISIFLPECINVIIRNSYMIRLSDFKTFIIFNLSNFYELYINIRLKLESLCSSSSKDNHD
jgi:hypothetical protein